MAVIHFPGPRNYPLQDVAACLRMLADEMEAGNFKGDHVLVIAYTPGDQMDYRAFGADFDRTQAAGMCAGASAIIISGDTIP